MRTFNRSASLNHRALSVGSPRVSRSSSASRQFHVPVIVIASLFTFALAISASYIIVVPSLKHTFHGETASQTDTESVSACDVFDGSWIRDDSHLPSYNASDCPFAEQGFNCFGNGRHDEEYVKWRWKPKQCDIQKFNANVILEWLRSKRLVFIGDSMSRTQWESLICLLMSGVEDKKSVYEVNGSKITKRIRYLGVRFSSFNFTIEFFRSVFLVQHGWTPRHAPKRVRSTLKLDQLDDISSQWIDSDVLIFNTGQWWVPGKLFETGCYFEVGRSLKLGMTIPSAFRKALETWASWVESAIDRERTHVFFRTFEPSHWSIRDQRRSCNVTQYPMPEAIRTDQYRFADIAEEVVQNMTFPVNMLRVTSLSAFRSDAHVGNWSDNPLVSDCSHWCLPGVPDLWNEILLHYLLSDEQLL